MRLRRFAAVLVFVLVPRLALSDPLRSPTGSLATAQEGHTATLLRSGQVLVAGGLSATSELYNPATGKWSSTGALRTARYGHTATLLPTGQVLVVGGFTIDSIGVLASAELYDPVSGTWSSTGSMVAMRHSHTATLLPSGRVVVAGGFSGAAVLSSLEIYDPVAGGWSPGGSLLTGRWLHTATLLSPSALLIAGGEDQTRSVLASAELVDLNSGRSISTGSMSWRRYLHTATLLQSGSVVVAGGSNATSLSLSTAEVSDPATRKWEASTPMVSRRVWHTATLLPSGAVLVAGGVDLLRGPRNTPEGLTLESVEVFEPGSRTWIATGSMANVRSGQTSTLLQSGKVLVTGGNQAAGTGAVTATTELYDPTAGLAPLISPANPSLAPSSSLAFGASGGSGNGYLWSFRQNQSVTATVSGTGVYTSGENAGAVDVIRLTDSAGNAATTVIGVEPLLVISPSSGELAPSARQLFTATGGMLGYTWDFIQNASGGSITDGMYQPGELGGGTDIIGVTDYIGVTAAATMTVTASLTILPASATVASSTSQRFTASGGSGTGFAWALIRPEPRSVNPAHIPPVARAVSRTSSA